MCLICRLGLGSLLEEMMRHEVEDDVKVEEEDNNDEEAQNGIDNNDLKADIDYDNKSPSAVDFSDITELAEEDLNEKQTIETGRPTIDYDADDEETGRDKQLMPPPSEPIKSEFPPKKLETPLAAMLPSKYANVNVTELFPDFRVGKVLRFSRLFGPGKPSSLPQIWRSVRRKRRKKRHNHRNSIDGKFKDSDSGSDQEVIKSRHKGFGLNYGSHPTPDQCRSDDEEKLLKEVAPGTNNQGDLNKDNEQSGPRVADWRFGPAQVWYDMLEVPETGDGFNYGFKLKDKVSSAHLNFGLILPTVFLI